MTAGARACRRYKVGHLIEVNAHSLFSKWFSESGKLVTKLFTKIMEFVEESDELVFVLMDEVESLTAARRSAAGGGEPSDAIRAVNSLLTHVDALKAHANVMVLCTSNLPEAVDAAFVDRADIKVRCKLQSANCSRSSIGSERSARASAHGVPAPLSGEGSILAAV